MKFIDKSLAGLFPKWAIRRLQAKQAISNYYEAAKQSRLRKNRTDKNSPDDVVESAAEALRIQARHLDENHDVSSGALDILVSNIVGLGVKPEPQVELSSGELADEFNEELTDLHDRWAKMPEVTEEHDLYSLQRLACRTWLRDGEVFGQKLMGRVRGFNHAMEVPLSLEMIEPDYVPLDFSDDDKGIVQGVKKNAWGAARAFYIYKKHPQEHGLIYQGGTKSISHERMLHLKFTKRFRQTRGVSIFAPVITRLDNIKELEESESVAARVAAAMTAYIKKGSPDFYLAPDSGDDYREMEFSPGMIFDDLNLGEDIGTIDTKRPNTKVVEFVDAMKRSAASGLMTSYSTLAKNYLGTFSAQRQELVEQYMIYGVLWEYFSSHFSRPIWMEFIKQAELSGAIKIPKEINRNTLFDVTLSRPAMPWVDPVKEMAGIEKELQLEITTKSDVIRRRGGNPKQVRKKVEEERPPEQEEEIEEGELVQTADGSYLMRKNNGYTPVEIKAVTES